ncbi:phospholipase d/transphosphatidylase [Apiospora arundinis]
MPELTWVSVGPYGKPRESDRKLIRSYCMRERNRRIGVDREKGQHARTGRGHAAIAPKPKHAAPDSQGRDARHPPTSSQTRPRRPPTEDRSQGPPCLVQQPSALKAVSALFAYEIDGAALELLQRFLVAFNKTVTYRFNGAVSFEPHQTVNTAWLLEDEAYLHSVLLVASAMWQGSGNTFSSLQGNTQTGYYMNKTFASLRQGLSSSTTSTTSSRRNVFLSDSRISVVATLAILSTNVGDMRALRAHIAGLVQMVRLRGGMRNILVQSPMLHAKISRVDVLWSLYSGEAPLFSSHHRSLPQSSTMPPDAIIQATT